MASTTVEQAVATGDVPRIPEETRERMREAEAALEQAQAITITSDDQYQAAAEQLSEIKGRAKALDEQRKAITKPLDDAKKRVMDMFRTPLDYLERAETAIKRAMSTYSREQEAKRLEAQRKAEEKAEAERRRAERLAAEHEAKGNEEKAEAWRDRAETTQAPIVPHETPKAAGVSTRRNWKGEVTDLQALCQAIAEGKAPARLVKPNDAEIGKYARALQDDAAVPGIRFWAEDVVAARSR